MTDKLRIVYMGTPDFAVAPLKVLVENDCNVVGVITAPDKPAGRGRKLNESAVKKYAVANGLNLLQPEKLKDPVFLEELKALDADLQVVVAFRMLPEVVWAMPSKGTFNLHASLLPHYRGAAPINRAVMNGETESGVTTFFIEKDIDTGKVIFQKKVDIATEDSAGILHNKLMNLGSELVLKTVHAIESGDFPQVDQSELIGQKELKSAPKIFKDDCRIHWAQPPVNVYNHIRGLSPFPTAWTVLEHIENGQTLSVKIFECTYKQSESVCTPGKIQTDNKSYLNIETMDGIIEVQTLQLAGKKRMKTPDLLRGFNLEDYRIKHP